MCFTGTRPDRETEEDPAPVPCGGDTPSGRRHCRGPGMAARAWGIPREGASLALTMALRHPLDPFLITCIKNGGADQVEQLHNHTHHRNPNPDKRPFPGGGLVPGNTQLSGSEDGTLSNRIREREKNPLRFFEPSWVPALVGVTCPGIQHVR